MTSGRKFKLLKTSLLLLAGGGVVFSFQNCGSGGSLPSAVNSSSSAPPSSALSSGTQSVSLRATYTPNPAPIGAVVTLIPSGGSGSLYALTVDSGGGNLDGMTYTTPLFAETAVITVMDGSGNSFPLSLQVQTTARQVPVYRGYNSTSQEHLMTLSASDFPTTFRLEGNPFNVFDVQADNRMIALYFCWILDSYHFLSVDPSCEGQTRYGVVGYIFRDQVPGTVPLYRRRLNPAYHINDYLETLSPTEGDPNYQTDMILGYVVHPK